MDIRGRSIRLPPPDSGAEPGAHPSDPESLQPVAVVHTDLRRFGREGKAVSLLKAQLALAALAELRAGERERAAKMLTELACRLR
jgi:hypothetical protein